MDAREFRLLRLRQCIDVVIKERLSTQYDIYIAIAKDVRVVAVRALQMRPPSIPSMPFKTPSV
jgi:hypothetical protein